MYKALGNIYGDLLTEAWNVPNRSGIIPPQQTANSIAYSQSFKPAWHDGVDAAEGNSNQMVFAGEQNQEVAGSIKKSKLFELIEKLISTLDNSNNSDRKALSVLGELKRKII